MSTPQAAAGLVLAGVLVAGCSASVPPDAGTPEAGPTTQRHDPSAPTERAGTRDPLAPGPAGIPRPPRSPREAAAQVVAAERAIADPATSRRRLAAAGHTQQVAYRELADRPRWDDRVARLLPAALRSVARDNV